MDQDKQAAGRAVLGGMHRRRFLALAGGMAGATILAACGSTGTATDMPRPANSVATAPAAATTASNVPSIASPVRATTTPGSAVAGAPSTGGLPTMTIEAFDYGYRSLRTISAGPTRIQLKNGGKEPHHAQFMLLNAGVTSSSPCAAFAKAAQGLDEVFGLMTQTGGPATVSPGSSSNDVILDLKEGQYIIACFVPGADHIPHFAKGMLMPLKVTAAPAAAAPAPAVNGTITLFDFNFTMPDTLPAGKSMYHEAA